MTDTRMPELTPQVMQSDIATAVRDAVALETNSSGHKRCQLDAAVGSIVATALTGTKYEFVATEVRLFRYPAANHSCWKPFFNPWAERVEEVKSEHCWAAAADESNLFVDFSTWQLKEYFERQFNIFNWDFNPPFYWGTGDDIPEPYGVWYGGCEITEELRKEVARDRRSQIEAITRRAFKLLEEKGYPRVYEGAYWPEWLTPPAKQSSGAYLSDRAWILPPPSFLPPGSP